MRQYFIDDILKTGVLHPLNDGQKHHVCDVLRMKQNDQIRIVDNNGNAFMSSLVIEGDDAFFKVEKQLPDKEKNEEIILCAAMIKRDKWELIIQKACELGADKIVPLITERTQIHPDRQEIEKKLIRYNKIALEACQQCNRNTIAEVCQPIKLKDISKYSRAVNFVCYEKERNLQISDLDLKQSCCFAVGPEGGFSTAEIEMLAEMGFVPVTLGEDILRAETACIYGLSVIKAWRNI